MDSFDCAFERADRWSGMYQRNNKRNKVKNLRCFPYCFDEHRTKSFCGQSVRVAFFRKSLADFAISPSSVRAWAEFGRADACERVQVGSTYALNDFSCLEHSRTNLANPLFHGQPCKAFLKEVETEFCFEFNGKRNGWNYSWTANTHTRKLKHCLYVYLFSKQGANQLRCIGIFRSPKFRICSLFARRSQKKILKGIRRDVTTRGDCGKIVENVKSVVPLAAVQLQLPSHEVVADGELDDIHTFFIETISAQDVSELVNTEIFEVGARQDSIYPNPSILNRPKRAKLDRTSPFAEVPLTSFDRPFPLRKIRKTSRRLSKSWDYSIPEQVTARLNETATSDRSAQTVNSRLWRICVVLTVMESQWASPPCPEEATENAKFGSIHASHGCRSDRDSGIKKRLEMVVHDLCSHLTGETQLLGSVSQQLRELGVRASSEERKKLFVEAVLSFVAKYLAANSLQLSEFCSAFPDSPSEDITLLAEERLRDILQYLDSFSIEGLPVCGTRSEDCRANGLLSKIDVYLYGQDLSLAGLWRSDEDVAYHLDVVRENFLGANWLFRRLSRYIESMVYSEVLDSRRIRFSIHTKLFRVADFVFIADGKIHEYQDNLFLAPVSRPLVKSYRLAVDYEQGCLTFEFFHNPHGQTKLLRRFHRPTQDNPRKGLLEVEFSKVNEETGAWEVMYYGTGFAIRAD